MPNTSKIRLEKTIALVALGDREAFADLYATTSAKLHAVCLSVLKDRPEAEETLQEVYVKIWQGAKGYASNRLSPMTWLITITRNHAIDRLRKRSSLPAISPTDGAAALPSGEPGPEAARIRAKEKMRLEKCLAQIGDDQTAAIRAIYLEGITYADLAGCEGKPLNIIRDWLRRSLLRLKECVGND